MRTLGPTLSSLEGIVVFDCIPFPVSTRECGPRTSTERESSNAILFKIALSPKRSLGKIASETVLPETLVGYTE